MRACRPRRVPHERLTAARPPGSCGAPWRSWTARLPPAVRGIRAQGKLTRSLCGSHAGAPGCGRKQVHVHVPLFPQLVRHFAAPGLPALHSCCGRRVGGLHAWRHRAALARLQQRARLRGPRAVAVARVHGRWVRAQRARPAALFRYCGHAAGCYAFAQFEGSRLHCVTANRRAAIPRSPGDCPWGTAIQGRLEPPKSRPRVAEGRGLVGRALLRETSFCMQAGCWF